jgi:thymidylate synthase (FAD)
MRVIKQSYVIIDHQPAEDVYRLIESAARVTRGSKAGGPAETEPFIRGLIAKGHESVLEHARVTALITTDRGVMAELTRHRLASFTIESTRAIAYYDPSGDIDAFQVIMPPEIERDDKAADFWRDHMRGVEQAYRLLLENGHPPEAARSVLPLAFATRIYMTANIRHWREIFRQRTARAAHPQMRALMRGLLASFAGLYPVLFDDINPEEDC